MEPPRAGLSLAALASRAADCSELRPHSKDSYLLAARQITDLLHTDDVSQVYRRARATVEAVQAVPHWKLRTKYNALTALAALARHGLVRGAELDVTGLALIQAKCEELRKVRDAAALSPAMPPQVRDVSWPDVVAVLAGLPHNSMERLIIGMYTLLPPRRLEYATLLTRPPASTAARQTANYLDVQAHAIRMVLNEYKTAAKHGPYETVLPAGIVDMIRHSLRSKPRDHLLLTVRGKPFSGNNALGQRVTQVLAERMQGRHITCTDLRKLYVSHHAPSMDMAARRALAHQMGHDAQTAFLFYQKDTAGGLASRAAGPVASKVADMERLVRTAASKLSAAGEHQTSKDLVAGWCDLARLVPGAVDKNAA